MYFVYVNYGYESEKLIAEYPEGYLSRAESKAKQYAKRYASSDDAVEVCRFSDSGEIFVDAVFHGK